MKLFILPAVIFFSFVKISTAEAGLCCFVDGAKDDKVKRYSFCDKKYQFTLPEREQKAIEACEEAGANDCKITYCET